MAPKSESFLERMKKQPLSFWGALCVFSGIFSGLAMNMMVDSAEMGRAEEQAVRLGGTIGGGLVVLVGVVLLVVHFVRRRRQR